MKRGNFIVYGFVIHHEEHEGHEEEITKEKVMEGAI
jgi:hypothetical protein